MTADAKIGLLLALVFIVAITFVINGLPGFLSKDEPEQTTPYVSHYRSADPGVVGSSRTATRRVTPAVQPLRIKRQAPAVVPMNNNTQRYTQVLPKAQAVIETTTTNIQTPTTTVVEIKKPNPVIVAPIQQKSQYYTVTSGDSLSRIAIKFYGSEAGNKLVNIKKIFKANRSTLKAIDDIRIGQKLIIPSIAEQTAPVVLETAKTPAVSAEYKQYTVKENDSLWKIAKANLGNGRRYLEVLKINKAIIPDSDRLTVGMKLNIPIK